MNTTIYQPDTKKSQSKTGILRGDKRDETTQEDKEKSRTGTMRRKQREVGTSYGMPLVPLKQIPVGRNIDCSYNRHIQKNIHVKECRIDSFTSLRTKAIGNIYCILFVRNFVNL